MNFLKLTTICMLAIATTGCLKVQETLTINKTGGGEIKIKYKISERAINQLNSMHKLQEQMQKFSGKPITNSEEARYAYMFLIPREKEIRKELESYKPFGVKIKKLKVETRNAWRHINMEVTFNDLKKISQLEIFKYAGFSLVRNKAGDYVFYKATEPTPNSNMPDISNESTLRKLSPILSGFQVIFMLKTPGTILKTNADRKSNNASIWSFDFDKDPKSILKLQKTKFVTIFSSSGLDLPEIRVNNM